MCNVSRCSLLNTSYPHKKQIDTIYGCSVGYVKGKNGSGMHINEKQLSGKQKKRRVITKRRGPIKVIDPSLPLSRYSNNSILCRRLQEEHSGTKHIATEWSQMKRLAIEPNS